MADAAPPTPDFAIAVAQFAPGADAEANLAEITRLTELAAARGARLVVFPEYSSYFTPEPGWDWPLRPSRWAAGSPSASRRSRRGSTCTSWRA